MGKGLIVVDLTYYHTQLTSKKVCKLLTYKSKSVKLKIKVFLINLLKQSKVVSYAGTCMTFTKKNKN